MMKYRVCKPGKAVMFLCVSLLVSCSDTPEQYRPSGVVGFERQRLLPPFMFDRASVATGGERVGQRPELSEEQKDIQIRERSLLPVLYKEGSAGGVHLDMTYEEAGKKLNLNFISAGGLFVYKEGVGVKWRADPPRTPQLIVVSGTTYQGLLDFGPWMGEKRKRKTGESFVDQFTPGVRDVKQDEKAKNFIVSTYKYWEDTEENCLQTKNCHLSINPQGNYVLFQFPKMKLLFGNNERRKLAQVAIIHNRDSGCFNRPLDIVKATFVCDPADDSRNITLGESYERVLEKSGINPHLPISYSSTYLVQRTRSAVVGWERTHREEKQKSIPPSASLSLVAVWSEYPSRFLVDGKWIEVHTDKQNQQVRLSLKDPSPPSEEVLPVAGEGSGSLKPSGDVSLQTTASPPVYLATDMAVLKGDYRLQHNFIEVLLNFLEKHFQQAYEEGRLFISEEAPVVTSSEGSLKPEEVFENKTAAQQGEQVLQPQKSFSSEEFKTYKRVFGKYDDRHASSACGILILKAHGRFLRLSVCMDKASGHMEFNMGLLHDHFTSYALENQKPLDLKAGSQGVAGFHLGEKLYLRSRDLGEETALVTYLSKDSKTLFSLADYDDEVESSVVYESGRDKNITFQLSEGVRMGGLYFYISPTGETKNLEGKDHEEYEIIGIKTSSEAFFEQIKNLCSVENLNMGMYDRSFTDLLVKTVHEGSGGDLKKAEEVCAYLSPQDTLFSGVKRLYFFPENKLVLGFKGRELSFLRIYKPPSPRQPKK